MNIKLIRKKDNYCYLYTEIIMCFIIIYIILVFNEITNCSFIIYISISII